MCLVEEDAKDKPADTSKPATSLARHLDRLPDGKYLLVLVKSSTPDPWYIQLLPLNGSKPIELSR